MKNVLFYIATEFHYMVSLSIIEKYYQGPEYKVFFLVGRNPLVSVNRLDHVGFDKNHIILNAGYEITSGKYYPDLAASLKEIKNQPFFHFVSFVYSDPLFVYLSYFFRQHKTPCFLAPDGMIAYVKFNKLNLRSRLYNTFYSYRFFARYRLFFPRWWFTSWEYGRNGYWDYIYAFSPSLPYLKCEKKIIEIEYTLSDEKTNLLADMYHTDLKAYEGMENAVLILNERHSGEAYEKELIALIADKLPGYTILFKKHPNTLAKNLEYLRDVKNVTVIDQIFPAELLISKLRHSLVISSYSTGSLYHNPGCRYYWTYPLVERYGVLRKPVTRFNPARHIKVISSMEELSHEFEVFRASDMPVTTCL